MTKKDIRNTCQKVIKTHNYRKTNISIEIIITNFKYYYIQIMLLLTLLLLLLFHV